MGIRVNKMIGYGLTNLKTRKLRPRDKYSPWVPRDSRWDYKKYLADWCSPNGDGDANKERDITHYLVWCQENKDHLIRLIAAERGNPVEHCRSDHYLLVEGIKDRIVRKTHWTAPYSAVEWDQEYGLRNVMLFVPAEHRHDWYRHDNIMDYYEEMGVDGPRRRATPLKGRTGVWPHDGVLKRFRLPTPEVAAKLTEGTPFLHAVTHEFAANREQDGADISRIPGGAYNQLIGKWSHNVGPVIKDPDVLRHFTEDWRPIVPLGVLALVEYLGCFPDAYGPEGIVNSLRPMIYVVWQ